MILVSQSKRRYKNKFNEILFLEHISRRLIQGYSLERAILDVLITSNDRNLRKRLVHLVRGEGYCKVIEGLPFESNLPLFILDIVRVRAKYAGKVAKELLSIMLLNKKCAKERSILFGLLYQRCLVISCLLGLSLAFLSQLAPILSTFYNFEIPFRASYAVQGILQSSFVLGISSSILLNLLFGKRKVLFSTFLYSVFFFLGYSLSLPISIMLHP